MCEVSYGYAQSVMIRKREMTMTGYTTITDLIKDDIERFLRERTIKDSAGMTGATELYRAWQEWCAAEGLYAASYTALGRVLGSIGMARVRRSSGVAYLGIRIGERDT